jgi:hypothetical protein
MIRHVSATLATVVLFAAAIGCASTSASKPSEFRGAVPRPARILVYDSP